MHMKTSCLVGAALTTAVSASMSLGATATFDYRDFANTSNLILKRDAVKINTFIDGPVIRLTTPHPSRLGVVQANSKVATGPGFHTEFTWRVSQINGISDPYTQGADGFYLSLGSSSAATGNTPVLDGSAVQIHIDTFKNAGDPTSNFVSAKINGVEVATGTMARPFDNGELWYGWVEYNGEQLKVYTAHEETHPLNPTLTLNVNLNQLLGPDAYIALGAKTSAGYAQQELVSWSYCAVPTPGAAALLGLGGLVVGRRRR